VSAPALARKVKKKKARVDGARPHSIRAALPERGTPGKIWRRRERKRSLERGGRPIELKRN
jgi:hypothetical protein